MPSDKPTHEQPFKLFFLIRKGDEFKVISVALPVGAPEETNDSFKLPEGWTFVSEIK